MSDRYDVVVVGVGGMGSATVAELATRGVDVLGLERYDVPNDYGSAHGNTRLVRRSDAQDRASQALLERAIDRWERLDADADRPLLYDTGSIDIGPADGETLAATKRVCDEYGLAYEHLSHADLEERYPAFEVPDEYAAVYQPDDGVLDPETCVVAQVTRAHRAGATIRARERVVDWRSTGEGVRVETDHGAYEADSLVLTAGAWTPRFVDALEEHAIPERQVLAWFQPDDPDRFGPDRFPAWRLSTPDGRYFGTPVQDVPGCPVGRYRHRNQRVDPDAFEREPTQADERRLRTVAAEYLPTATGPTMRLSTRLRTRTPDDAFVLDTHPDHPEVVVGAGCSPSGFAATPAIGDVLADLALEGTSDREIEPFSIDRF